MTQKFFATFASAEFDDIYHGFVLANAALAMGAEATLFFGAGSVNALKKIPVLMNDRKLPGTLASFDELRSVAAELGARLIACETGLKMLGLEQDDLVPQVQIGGAVGFLALAGANPILGL